MTTPRFDESLNKHLRPDTPSISIPVRNVVEADAHEYHLDDLGFTSQRVLRNPSVAKLYEEALKNEKGSLISSSGALAVRSGAKTGRSPKDKRIVEEETTKKDIWWGPVNIPLTEESFAINRERAVDYLNTREQIYVIDAFAGWSPKYQIKVRVICSRAYHALFMWNMLIRPTEEELEKFGDPDLVIYNAGSFPANKFTKGMTSNASVAVNFKKMEMVILGTEYAGEMKKGVFTVMHYLMPKRGQLSLHSSCNVSRDGSNIALFFGLSGTGKTTLSADLRRNLVGDDEHVWTEDGVFNIEGGCYAKCDGLSRAQEPEIFDAVRFGAVLENVVMNPDTRVVDFKDTSLTPNTRTAYPLENIPNTLFPAMCGHPTNVILLTCDAFGVLPPVAKLTMAQVEYHFINGYTSKTPGTEVGVTTPQAVFSACYGEPFLVWHPGVYAKMLADRLQHHGANAWLLNTGWSGGGYGVGSRMKLSITRKILDSIHSGVLATAETVELPIFGFRVPKAVDGVPSEILNPENTWTDKAAYMEELKRLGGFFLKNTEMYASGLTPEVLAAGPKDCKPADKVPGRGAG